LTGESEPIQGTVEPIAALVSGKHPACAIATMRCWSQADDEKSSLRVAKAGQWFPPVFTFSILSPLLVRHTCPILN